MLLLERAHERLQFLLGRRDRDPWRQPPVDAQMLARAAGVRGCRVVPQGKPDLRIVVRALGDDVAEAAGEDAV